MIRHMMSFWGIKIGVKFEHLSNFTSVTLQVLC